MVPGGSGGHPAVSEIAVDGVGNREQRGESLRISESSDGSGGSAIVDPGVGIPGDPAVSENTISGEVRRGKGRGRAPTFRVTSA